MKWVDCSPEYGRHARHADFYISAIKRSHDKVGDCHEHPATNAVAVAAIERPQTIIDKLRSCSFAMLWPVQLDMPTA